MFLLGGFTLTNEFKTIRIQVATLLFSTTLVLYGCAGYTSDQFRVKPYVQNPAENEVTLIWFSNENVPGTVMLEMQEQEGGHKATFSGVVFSADAMKLTSSPFRASALQYSPMELNNLTEGQSTSSPYQHQLRLTGLSSGQLYRYSVTQGGQNAIGTFRTPGDLNSPVRLIVYADSETEPESAGKRVKWPDVDNIYENRLYLVDQDQGYRENLSVIADRHPDFVAIAGDLVESGGEQRDWDEFWRHNATLAASTPILPALGNHEYYGGPDEFGAWGVAETESSVEKYKTYFDLPDNSSTNERHGERYYALEYGPITLIVLDVNNGFPNQSAQDTNWSLLGEYDGAVAPAWADGSEQYSWLEKQLNRAQHNSRFTFVMFHYCPYTSGIHGLPAGLDTDETNNASAIPLQALTPIFTQYGVDLVLTGHDEMAEHSIIRAIRKTKNGASVNHELHIYDAGIGGDGLRGPFPGVANPHRSFLAHRDAPEIYDEDGVLIDGGKHYGHLEINVAPNQDKKWEAVIDFVYVFPVTNSKAEVTRFERRVYKDRTVIHEKN